MYRGIKEITMYFAHKLHFWKSRTPGNIFLHWRKLIARQKLNNLYFYFIQVSSPPSEPITLEWMKTRLSNIKDDLVTNQTQKSQVDKCIAESKVNNSGFIKLPHFVPHSLCAFVEV